MITDLFVFMFPTQRSEAVIWSGQWSAVSCCDSESDEVLIDVSAGLLKKKKKLVQVTASDIGGKIGKK